MEKEGEPHFFAVCNGKDNLCFLLVENPFFQ